MAHIPTTDTVDVYRMARTGQRDAYGDEAEYTGLDCLIVPAGPDIVAVYGGQPSLALFEIYFNEVVTLRNGDKLVTATDVAYVVRGVPQKVENRYLYYQKVIGEMVLP